LRNKANLVGYLCKKEIARASALGKQKSGPDKRY
jgi:hypothetical protein